MEVKNQPDTISLQSLQTALPAATSPQTPHPLSQSFTANTPPSAPSPLKRSTSASVLSASEEEDDEDDQVSEDESDDEHGPVKKPTKLKYTTSKKHLQPPVHEAALPAPVLAATTTVDGKPSKPKADQRQIDSDSEGSEANSVDPALTTDSDAEDEELEQDGNGISLPTRRKTKRRPKNNVAVSLSETSRSSRTPSVASSSNPYQPLTAHHQQPYHQPYPGGPGAVGARVAAPSHPQQGTYFYPYEQIQGGPGNGRDEDDVPLAAVKATGSETFVPSRNSVVLPENMQGYPRGGYGQPRAGYVDRPGPPQGYWMNPPGYPNQYNDYGPVDGSQYSGSGPRSINSGYRHPGFYDHDGFSAQSGYSEYSDNFSDEEYPMDPSQLPPADYRPGSSSLLGSAEQARQNALNAPRYGPLIDVPRKPPPPQTGLLGAITARERAKEANKYKPMARGVANPNSGAEIQRERAFEMEKERRLQEQRQSVYFDEMARRQQMMGMYPPMQGYGPYYNNSGNVDPYRYPMPGEPTMMGSTYGGPPGHPVRPYGMMGRPGYYGPSSGGGTDDGDEDDDVVLAAIKKPGSVDGTAPEKKTTSDSGTLASHQNLGAVQPTPVKPAAALDPSAPLHPLSENLPHVPSSVLHSFDKFIEEKLSMKPHSRISTSVLYRAYVNWAATRPRADPKSKEVVAGGEGTEANAGDKEKKVEEAEPEEEEEEEGEYVEQGVFSELMMENGFVKKLKKGSTTVEEWYNVTLVKI